MQVTQLLSFHVQLQFKKLVYKCNKSPTLNLKESPNFSFWSDSGVCIMIWAVTQSRCLLIVIKSLHENSFHFCMENLELLRQSNPQRRDIIFLLQLAGWIEGILLFQAAVLSGLNHVVITCW